MRLVSFERKTGEKCHKNIMKVKNTTFLVSDWKEIKLEKILTPLTNK